MKIIFVHQIQIFIMMNYQNERTSLGKQERCFKTDPIEWLVD